MPAFTLVEDFSHFDLRPFTFARPVYHLRSGILTFYEKWEKALNTQLFTDCIDFHMDLSGKDSLARDIIWINGKFGPDAYLLEAINAIDPGSFLTNEAGEVLLARSNASATFSPPISPITPNALEEMGYRAIKTSHHALGIREVSDIFSLNREFIIRDFDLITQRENTQPLTDPYTRVYGKDNLFISEGASIRAAIINAEDGPVYIGKNATVKEGSIIINAHGIGDNSTVSVGAKLRGDTSIGPWSKAGGEIGNSVIMGYANKGHDGYLGNSVMGYWSNLGADSNTSNLKNNYGTIKVWHYPSRDFRNTGMQFHGLIMGDHSKCGINTMFNTGTVVGISSNIFGGGFPPKFIPSFAWGGAGGFQTYRLEKAMETAERVMARRKIPLGEKEKKLLTYIFEQTRIFRNWETE